MNFKKFFHGFDLRGNKIKNAKVDAPQQPQDIANKEYVDAGGVYETETAELFDGQPTPKFPWLSGILGKSVVEIFDKLFYPVINPTYVNPEFINVKLNFGKFLYKKLGQTILITYDGTTDSDRLSFESVARIRVVDWNNNISYFSDYTENDGTFEFEFPFDSDNVKEMHLVQGFNPITVVKQNNYGEDYVAPGFQLPFELSYDLMEGVTLHNPFLYAKVSDINNLENTAQDPFADSNGLIRTHDFLILEGGNNGDNLIYLFVDTKLLTEHGLVIDNSLVPKSVLNNISVLFTEDEPFYTVFKIDLGYYPELTAMPIGFNTEDLESLNLFTLNDYANPADFISKNSMGYHDIDLTQQNYLTVNHEIRNFIVLSADDDNFEIHGINFGLASDNEEILPYDGMEVVVTNNSTKELKVIRNSSENVDVAFELEDDLDLSIKGSFVFKYKHNDDPAQRKFYLLGGGAGGSGEFQQDIVVSLSGTKTVGRFQSGETIPAAGKTFEEVMFMIAQEPIAPTVNLASPTSVKFNQTAINNVLNFSWIINSLGSTIQSMELSWRRNNTGTWTVLTTNTSLNTFTHSMTDTAFNTQQFNYRLIVTDMAGGTATATINVVPQSYVAPATSLVVTAASLLSYETSLIREKGNVSSNISATLTSNNQFVDLVSYLWQYRSNGGSWIDIGVALPISGQSANVAQSNHNEASLVNSNTIEYRLAVTDQYQTSYISASVINFRFAYIYGFNASQILNSTQITSLPAANKQLLTSRSRTITGVTAGVGMYTHLAYPTTFGDLTSIIMDGAAPVLTAFTKATVSVTNPYNVTQNYNHYYSNASQAFTNNQLAMS